MEVNGKEFLRNVSIEKDKADLEDQRKKLDEQKRVSMKKAPEYFESHNISDDSAYVNISNDNSHLHEEENNLLDIKLDNKSNASNKKKMILLGIGLIILFIITIIVMRVISNNEQEEELENTSKPTQTLNKDKILDRIDSIEEYQKVIDKSPKPKIEEIEKKDIILPEATKELSPIKSEEPIIKKEIKKDLFELEEKPVQKVQKIVEKPKPKPVVKQKPVVQSKPKREVVIPPTVETNFTKKTAAKVKGYYIQIGAFTKKPSDKLLRSITIKGYKYTIHKINIKGRDYNKVLIGSYSSKSAATKVISKVRKDFNNPKAYILKF
ncbi:MAG: SPOR domain-containing protein [Campylobacterota bacterium]|nr:SPOR domain-containing protein [Campylobacterota bacterium]